ncbi:MAG: hypothetical protein HQL23_03025 [Candidatus Omnitrophica bacterium]|nr:hypothetical protein [Candidatus Omnitrophota bacterium]
MNLFKMIITLGLICLLGFAGYQWWGKFGRENAALKQMISRLEADSRAAEVLVTKVTRDEKTGKNLTTIKFLEYDTSGQPLAPRYFSFSGNIIQFQSLVIRFENDLVRQGDPWRGKSVYLFWKVFLLDGKNTQEFQISRPFAVPDAYRVSEQPIGIEKRFWEKFWDYALSEKYRQNLGIKNAQIEAPGTAFIPGILYTIKIEHSGGLRIDAAPLPAILRGETIQ